ncbi:crossover junction endonuclease MUS81 [Nematocida homosporus]|uniref:crossover junction endonuclease MUS81 n=1 Tax=Nematocida homosporus TaxID=1912981 RepID=UPI00221EA4CA|nr:crossover junction endonuclease MUS81 [Nematocida homosporus]KAI5185248.1 crossover junction endonuclease MUS81 [Nematocida homosporus]
MAEDKAPEVRRVLLGLVDREVVQMRITGSGHRLARYKRAAASVEAHTGPISSLAELLAIKHIGKSTAAEVQRLLIESGLGGLAGDATVVDVDSGRDQAESATQPSKIGAFQVNYQQQVVQIGGNRKSWKRVFGVVVGGEEWKVPVLFSLAHLVLQVLEEECVSYNDTVKSVSYLRYKCMDQALRHQVEYGTRLVAECTEKRVKGIVQLLIRHGLVKGLDNLTPTIAGRRTALFIKQAVNWQEHSCSLATATMNWARMGSTNTICNVNSQNANANANLSVPITLSRPVSSTVTNTLSTPLNPSLTQSSPNSASHLTIPVLLVDSRERAGTNPFFFGSSLGRLGVPIENRVLPIGDFVWMGVNGSTELFLGTIAERKTIRDLMHSLRDGRYMEQKHRLKAITGRKIYLIEGSIPLANLAVTKSYFTASFSLIIEGFLLLPTRSIEETLAVLHGISAYLAEKIDNNHMQVDSPLSSLLLHAQKRKTEDWAPKDRMISYISAIRGISFFAASQIVALYPSWSKLTQAAQSPSILLPQLAEIKTAPEGKALGRRRAQAFLTALGY